MINKIFRSIAIVLGLLLVILSMVAVSSEAKAQVSLGATWGKVIELYPKGDFHKIGSFRDKYTLEGHNNDGDLTYYFNKDGRANKVVWRIYEKEYVEYLIKFYNESALLQTSDHRWVINGSMNNMYVVYNKRHMTFTFYDAG